MLVNRKLGASFNRQDACTAEVACPIAPIKDSRNGAFQVTTILDAS
jgi:hypothetical protein